MEVDHKKNVASGLFVLACPVCFPIQSGDCYPEVALATVDWSLSLTALINKCSSDLPESNLVGVLSCSSSEVSLTFINLKNVLPIQSLCSYPSLPLLCYAHQYRQIAQLRVVGMVQPLKLLQKIGST